MCKGLCPDSFIKQRKLWYKESQADLPWFMQFDSEPNNLSHKANVSCRIYFLKSPCQAVWLHGNDRPFYGTPLKLGPRGREIFYHEEIFGWVQFEASLKCNRTACQVTFPLNSNTAQDLIPYLRQRDPSLPKAARPPSHRRTSVSD